MKKPLQLSKQCAALLAAAACATSASADPNLTNQLVSYWPLSSTNTGQSTSDVQNGYDLQPISGSAVTTFSGASMSLASDPHFTNVIVLGNNGLLGYKSPQNAQGTPSTPLPPTQFPNWTISLWVKGSLASMPAGGGDRIFASGYSLSTSPVLDFNTGGTGGASGETTSVLDNFVRQYGSVETANAQGTIYANYTGGSHSQINANPWDGTWHNLTVTAQMITNEPEPTLVGPLTNQVGGVYYVTFGGTPLDSLTGTNAGSPFLTTNAQGVLIGNEQVEADTNQQYILQVSTNLAGPWQNVVSNATVGYYAPAASPPIGYVQMVDTNSTNIQEFYRVIQPGVRLQNWSFYLDGHFISSSLQFTNGVNIQVPVGTPVPEGGTTYLQNTGNNPGGSDPRAIQPPYGIWACDQFSLGGLYRTSAGSYLPSGTEIAQAGVWARALSSTEISEYMVDGITNAAGIVPASSVLNEDFPAVAAGDNQNLTWSGTKDATSFVLNSTPGSPVNVTADTTAGLGSYQEAISATVTNSLTVTRSGVGIVSSKVPTQAVPGVASCWHYMDAFTYLPDGWINSQPTTASTIAQWQNPPAAIYTGLFHFQVYSASGNNYGSFDGGAAGAAGNGGLAGRLLNSDSVGLNGAGTLFFRFYLDPSLANIDNSYGLFPDVDCNIGITDQFLRDPIDFDGLNGGAGPGIFIVRNQGGAGGAVDLTGSDGPASMALSPGGYSWVADTFNNPGGNGLDLGAVYDIWIDYTNQAAEVAGGFGSGGIQTNGCLYRVWMQEVAGPNVMASRVNLFGAITPTTSQTTQIFPQGWLVSGRDYSTSDPSQPQSELLSSLYLCTSKNISPEDTNMLRMDDFYLSSCGTYNSALPTSDPAVTAFGPENPY